MPFSTPVLIWFTVAPMTTGFISAAGSSTIMVMICRSKKKFGDPYRRLVFGISFFDLLSSLANVLKIFKTTPEQPNAWVKLGNQTSCDVLGFIHFVGLNGALLYNVSLNVYYLCLVKYNMKTKNYSNRVEPFLHAVPILWALISASIIVATGHMNPTFAGECLIAPYPVNCLVKPDVECVRGRHSNLFRTLFRVLPTLGSLAGILVTLGMLWWTVQSQERKINRYRLSMVSVRMQSLLTTEDVSEQSGPLKRLSFKVRGSLTRLRGSLSRTSNPQEPEDETKSMVLSQSLRGRMRSTKKKGRSFLIQARWYVVAFILTHACPIIVIATEFGGKRPALGVLLVARFLVPLQGLFNIIVYTRPQVNKLRLRNPAMSRWAAFKKVVASGGDDDDDRLGQLRQGRRKKSVRSHQSQSLSKSNILRYSKDIQKKEEKSKQADASSSASTSHPSHTSVSFASKEKSFGPSDGNQDLSCDISHEFDGAVGHNKHETEQKESDALDSTPDGDIEEASKLSHDEVN